MLEVDGALLSTWISPVFWPFLRILGLFSAAPLLSMKVIPMRVRVGLALLMAVMLQSRLAAHPVISLDEERALGVVVTEVLLGLAIGFCLRQILTVIELAGELTGLQMGLNYAGYFDPSTHDSTNAVARFYLTLGSLVLLSLNGHILFLEAVSRSFELLPVAGLPGGPSGFEWMGQIPRLGEVVFSAGLWMALPVVALLMMVNLFLGIISRVVPQANVFVLGFPITVLMGLGAIWLTLPWMVEPLSDTMQQVHNFLLTLGRR